MAIETAAAATPLATVDYVLILFSCAFLIGRGFIF